MECGDSCHPVFDLLDRAAAEFGENPAFDFLGYKQNWADIHSLSLKFAKSLQDMGIGRGKKVGLFLPNCPYFVIAYYAILYTGATAVHFNPLYARRELAAQIEDSETDLMITLDLEILYEKVQQMLHDTRLDHIVICRFTDVLPPLKSWLFRTFKRKEIAYVQAGKRTSFFHEMVAHEVAPLPAEIDPKEDVALFQYTGGTTGLPKAAMLTHANIVANTEQAALWFHDCHPGQDKMLGVIPFFHVFAMTAVMNLSVRKGLEIIATPRFDLDETLKTISKKKPTVFPAVPAIYTAINNHKKLKRYDLSSLRYCVSGGAALPVEVKKTFEEKTGCVLVEGYGLTETSPVLCVNPVEGENKPGSIGLPLPATVIEIVSAEDGKTIMPAGQRGELCARGPQVMKGYWKRPKETRETMHEDRLHTGDIAVMDEDGYFFIVDRIKDLIITNGYNVYPRNVEEAIYLHPSVEECIVAGLPDKQRGEIVKAWIKCKTGRFLTFEDLREFLKDKISPMEIPKRVEFRDQPLPKTMIGKLSRKDVLAEEVMD